MDQSDFLPLGHRVRTRLKLSETERDRLLGGVLRSGSKSVMFRFHNVTEENVGDMFGAFIDALHLGADDEIHADLRFWDPIAPIYVLAGQCFDVWYMRTVGEGTVLEVIS